MTNAREVAVGGVIILSVLVAAVGTLWLQGSNWGREFTPVEVLVRDVGQLAEGNEATFRGVSVGTVESIEVEQPGASAVRVRLQLEGEVELADDAGVVVAPESMFGDWQIQIVSRSRFPRYDFYPVEDGRTEDGVRVLGGYALPDISRLTATAEAVSQNLAELTDRVERAFTEETAENLQLAIGNLQQVSEDVKNLIQQQASTFERVSAQVEQTTTEINAAARTASSTLEHADRILGQGEIDTILVNLADASRRFDDIAVNVEGASAGLDSTLARADSTFARVDRLTATVAGGEGSLGRLLTDTTFIARAERLMARFDSLLADVQANPGRYIRLSIF